MADHPLQDLVVDGYEPRFDRLSTTRRVLAHVTDEDHVDRGPRNTVKRLAEELAEDPHTPKITGDSAVDDVQTHVDRLVDAGLLERRDDETLALTREGRVELVN